MLPGIPHAVVLSGFRSGERCREDTQDGQGDQAAGRPGSRGSLGTKGPERTAGAAGGSTQEPGPLERPSGVSMVGGWTEAGRLRPLSRAGQAEVGEAEGQGRGLLAEGLSQAPGQSSTPDPRWLGQGQCEAKEPAASRSGHPACGDRADGGQAGWGAEKTSGEAFFRKWSTVLRSSEASRECAVSRSRVPGGGGSAQRIPSRSGPATTVTGCKVLKWAFHGNADGRRLSAAQPGGCECAPTRAQGARPPSLCALCPQSRTQLGASAGVGSWRCWAVCGESSGGGGAHAGPAGRERRGWDGQSAGLR